MDLRKSSENYSRGLPSAGLCPSQVEQRFQRRWSSRRCCSSRLFMALRLSSVLSSFCSLLGKTMHLMMDQMMTRQLRMSTKQWSLTSLMFYAMNPRCQSSIWRLVMISVQLVEHSWCFFYSSERWSLMRTLLQKETGSRQDLYLSIMSPSCPQCQLQTLYFLLQSFSCSMFLSKWCQQLRHFCFSFYSCRDMPSCFIFWSEMMFSLAFLSICRENSLYSLERLVMWLDFQQQRLFLTTNYSNWVISPLIFWEKELLSSITRLMKVNSFYFTSLMLSERRTTLRICSIVSLFFSIGSITINYRQHYNRLSAAILSIIGSITIDYRQHHYQLLLPINPKWESTFPMPHSAFKPFVIIKQGHYAPNTHLPHGQPFSFREALVRPFGEGQVRPFADRTHAHRRGKDGPLQLSVCQEPARAVHCQNIRHRQSTILLTRNREVEGSLSDIFQTLNWIGITPDESIEQGGSLGPYQQSQRTATYRTIQKNLLKAGKAYPCFCSQTEKEEHQFYSGKCRNLSLQQIKTKIGNKEPFAVRIKSDLLEWPQMFQDQVFGAMKFKAIDDFVIVRRNGWPTFHFANVVDDWQMKVTHVMRGEEWLTNTNKHIYLYRVLDAPVPKWVHLPLIKAMNGKKLAKRDPDSSVVQLRDGDYEVEAVRSFIYGLGLGKGGKQDERSSQTKEQQEEQQTSSKGKDKQKKEDHLKLTSFEQMVAQFNTKSISKSPVKFDKKQLDHLNKLALRQRWHHGKSNPQELVYFVSKVKELIPISKSFSEQYITDMLDAVVERFNFISDIAHYEYYFTHPDYFSHQSQKDFQKIFGAGSYLSGRGLSFVPVGCDPDLLDKNRKIIYNIRIILEHVIPPSQYNEVQVAKHLSQFLYQSPHLKNEDMFHLLRYMVSGRKSGPNITKACGIIGRDTVLRRIAAFEGI